MIELLHLKNEYNLIILKNISLVIIVKTRSLVRVLASHSTVDSSCEHSKALTGTFEEKMIPIIATLMIDLFIFLCNRIGFLYGIVVMKIIFVFYCNLI